MTRRPGDPEEGFEETVMAGSGPTTDGMAATTPASPAADSLADTIPPERPDSIGRYTIRGVLGRGGMGVVYVGYDANLEREVAIKLVRAAAAGGSDGPTRLKREARIMAQLSHPNLVTVHEVGEHDGQVYVAMELVKGLTLRRWLRKQDRDWRDIVDVYLNAARGLAAAHKVGVIHRDFKPDNVIVADDGRVRVLDFGLARPVDSHPGVSRPTTDADAPTNLTMTGAVMGTPAYMPPEQHEGKVTDARADQFSYCVALFEALYGGRPFVGNSILELAKATTTGEVTERPTNTKVPRRVHDVILRGLERDPNHRHGAMDDLINDLDRLSRRRNNTVVLGAAVLATAAIAGGLFLYQRGGGAPPVDATCKPVASQLAGVWDQRAQSRIRQRFNAASKPFVRDVWRSVRSDFESYVGAWTQAQRQICDRTDERDRLLRAQQLTCLDDHMLRMRGYISAAAEVDTTAFALAFTGFNVATAAECVDGDVVRARATAPASNIADAVAEHRLSVYRASTHVASHRFVKLDTLTPHLLTMKRASERLKQLGHGPAHAESLLYLGRALGYANKTAQAKKVLETAIDIAETNRADTTVARLLIRLVHQQAFRGGVKANIAALTKRARIALTRAGKPAMLTGQLLHTQAHLANIEQRFDDAVTLAKQAHTAFSRALPPQSYRLALIESDLARFAALRKQRDVRMAHLSVAVDSFERLLGAEHPRLGDVLARMAQVYHQDPTTRRKGLSFARRGLRVLDNARGHASPWLGRAMEAVGRTLQLYARSDDAQRAFRGALASLDPVYPRSGYAFVAALAQVSDHEWNVLLDAHSAAKHVTRCIELMTKTYPEKNLAVMRPQLLLAAIRLGQGNFPEAIRLANAVLLAPKRTTGYDWPRPHRFKAAGLLARIAAEQRQGAKAMAYLEQMGSLKEAPSDAIREALTRGHVSLSLNQLANAIAAFTSALKGEALRGVPAEVARGYLAVARARAGQLGKAIPQLRAAVARDPGKGHPLAVLARFELAKALWARGKRSQAKDHASKARNSLKRFSPKRARQQKAIDRWLKIR